MLTHPVLIILILFCTSFCEGQSAETSQFKLGVVLALTGPTSVHGVPIRKAIDLASDQLDINASKKIEIIYEDDAFLASNTVKAVHKLIYIDKVNALIVYGTTMGLAVVDIIEKAQIPFLSINVHRSVVKGRKYSYLMMPSIESTMIPLIKESKRRKHDRIYTVSSIQDSCLFQSEIFKSESGLNVIGYSEFLPTEVSFGDLAVKIRSKSPGAVFLSTLVPQGAILAKKLREIGYKGDLFAGIQESSFAELSLSNNALLDAYITSGDQRSAISYFKLYKDRYGSDPSTEFDFAVYGYNAFHLLLAGINSGNVIKFLSSVNNFPSVVGPISADAQNGFTFPVALKKFTKDGFEVFVRRIN